MITRTGRCGGCLDISRGARVLALGLGLLLAGCKDSAIIRTEEVNSPDGYWIAKMEIEQFGGPGTAGLLTYVYLVRANTGDEPIKILALSDEAMSTAQVQMHWEDNEHLDIGHFPESKVGFQVIKCGGVDISVH